MKNRKKSPPRFIKLLVSKLSVYENEHALTDAIEEEYFERRDRLGPFISRIWYWLCAVGVLFHYLNFSFYWRVTMFINYLKITLRNIKRNKTYSLINISGLVVGFTCFVLIFLYVRYEKSFDAFHENLDCIFRVMTRDPGNTERGNDTWAASSAAIAPTLMEEFPEVNSATRIRPVGRLLLSKEEKNFYERGLYTDEHFFDVFSFPLIRGDRNKVLDNPLSIIISERLAMKFFGNDDPIGRTLNCVHGDMEVTGIVENVPENSHIQFDWIISFKLIKASIERNRNPQFFWWGALNYYTYCMLKDTSFKDILGEKIAASMNKRYRDFGWKDMEYEYILQPLKSIHLQSRLNFEFSVNNSGKLILLFSIIAIFILVIACINSTNLSSAHAAKRMKEIGIRKMVGGQRSQIFWQFTGESLLISTLSLIIAAGIVCVFIPAFNGFVERNIDLKWILEWSFGLYMLAFLLVSSLLAGLYPAVVLSSFKPADAVKDKTGVPDKGRKFRNLLVMFQFSITIALIISSLVMFLQIRYIQKRPLGYNREHVVVLRLSDPGIRKNFTAFKDTILQSPNVIQVTTSDALPTSVGNTWGGGKFLTDEGVVQKLRTKLLWIDFDFLDFYQMEILQGRNFSEKYGTDPSTAVILNETFVRNLNWSSPVGQRIRIYNNEEKVVVGVVKDFHFQSLHNEIIPIIIFCRPNNRNFHIRISADNIPETLGYIRRTYDGFKTRYPFEYFFLDDSFNQMYSSEQKLGQMLAFFSGLGIFIACLGMFGLASFTAKRRTKEIGIRKVLGASVLKIVILLSGGFTKWVVIANFIAWPAAYYAMHKWLQSFAYRIGLGIGIFLFAGLVALGIALLTVSVQTFKAATANPVDSLRYE